jgi:FkbM family methyltransferase
MSIQPSAIDPPEVAAQLWEGLGGRVGFDIGANCGQSLAFMRTACPEVHAFEPGEEAFAYLVEHFPDAASVGVHLHNYAVSDVNGEVSLAAIPSQVATGQLVTPGTQGMEWSPENWDNVPRRKVASRTVDDLAAFVAWPEVIKVDTEGHEAHVLRGAPMVLSERLTQWLIEFHSNELLHACEDMLQEAGYRTQVIRHPHYLPDTPLWHGHGWLKALGPLRGKLFGR